MSAPGNRWKMIVGTLVVLWAMVMIWEELLEDRLIPKRWGVVEEGSIYRSGQLHAALVKSTLADHGIIALYRALVQGWDLQDILAEMGNYRFDREDDEVLLRFLDNNMAFIGRRLKQLGAITEEPDLLPKFLTPRGERSPPA
jgi:hypothetical protein